MNTDDTYRTIASASEGSFKDKGSKFLSFAFPVESEDVIKEIIKATKKKYHDARHHCYAYRLEENGEVYRINDDGEPSGTAGRPIYGQILSKELTNVLILVVRYFGGTLLGTSGLINAYRSASEDCLSNAQIIEKIVKRNLKIHFPYEQMGVVMRILKEENITISRQEFDFQCSMDISVRKSSFQHSSDRLAKVDGIELILS